MKPDWKSYAELLGLTAVVASLIFVGLELRQSQAIAEAEMTSNALANIIEVRNSIIGNAEIWNKGNENKELTPVEEVIYAELVGLINDRFYFSVEQQELLAIEEFEGLDVAEFAGFLYENPRALHLWRAKEERLAKYRGIVRPNEQLTSEWITKVESALTKFERDADDSQ